MQQGIDDAINRRRDEMVALLQELVSIDSGTHCARGVTHIAQLIGDRLRRTGYLVEEQPSNAYGHSLLVRGAKRGGPKVVLMGHIDTVWPEGEAQRRPFMIRNGKAFGPGAHDMKSGITVMVFVAELLQELAWDGGEIVLLFNGQEEVGSPETRNLIQAEATSAAVVLNLEPQLVPDSVVTERPGHGVLTVTCQGRSAQAGSGWTVGANAIHELLERLQRIRRMDMPGTRLNVDIIHGGREVNVIPDYAQALVDVRFSSLAEWEQLKVALDRIHQESGTCRTTLCIDTSLRMPPLLRNERVMQAFEQLREIAWDQGRDLHQMHLGSEADGSLAAATGAPTLDGVGVYGAKAHHQDEWTCLESMFTQTRLLVAAVQEFALRSVN